MTFLTDTFFHQALRVILAALVVTFAPIYWREFVRIWFAEKRNFVRSLSPTNLKEEE